MTTIKAYSIDSFFVDKITGKCLAEVSFTNKTGSKAFLHPLTNLNNAVAYVDKEARDWFLPVMEDFVNHKKHIITEDNKEQFTELKWCDNALIACENYTTENICERFLKGFAHFKNILPNPNNTSYETSCKALEEMKIFAEGFLKFKSIVK